MFWRRLATTFQLLLLLMAVVLLLARETPAFGTEEDKLNALVGQRQFDFLVWETVAFLSKAEAALTSGHTFLTEAERKQVVLDYLDLLFYVQTINTAITNLYVDPAITDPDAASADLQAQLLQSRSELNDMQPLAEAILQDQVTAVLADEGFDIAGQTWPPVMMHMTPLPWVMIISPRDRIERLYQRTLVPGLNTAEHEGLETAVNSTLDLSALVVPIGGLGTYPSMIQESTNINWLAEVTAHEWSHHWMGFYPVGLFYNQPDVRIINETIASIIDQEIGTKVIARYYPEFSPPPAPPSNPAPPAPDPNTPPPFDFRAEMAATRIRVDELLAEGEIEEAETFMEEQRLVFVENGYSIRKLNQAYFAFYGAYAAEPGGATGSDPTGPMLRDIRAQSPSLRAFMDTVAPVNSLAELEQIWQEMGGGEE